MKQIQEIDITPILRRTKEDVLETVKTLVRPYQFPIIQEVSLGQHQALDKLRGGWYITACWLADPNGESSKRLFKSPEFQDRKNWASYLASLLGLCNGVKELFPNVPYKTGQEWGVACVCEWQQWGVNYILNFDLHNPVYKSDKISKLGLLYKELSEAYRCAPSRRKVAQNPFKKQAGQLHHYDLFKCAEKLAVELPDQEQVDFCRKFWTPFLDSLHDYKNVIKNNSALKVALPEHDALRYQGVGKDRRRVNVSNLKILTVEPEFYQ